jgi:hypothetical protein
MRIPLGPGSEETPVLNSTGDVALPVDFDRRLELLLAERPLRILIVLAQLEAGLGYFLRRFHRKLDRLATGSQFRFEVLSTDAHDFSATDESASKLNDLITDWVRKSWSWDTSKRSVVRQALPRAGAKLRAREQTEWPTI